VLMLSGLDSAKEEMGAYEQPFLDRGMATLAFDGPGQGEAEYDLPIRSDWEVPVGAVLDWLDGQDRVDHARVALFGVSLGGYYAPRAAAFHPRVRACIAVSGPYDLSAEWDRLPALTRETFRVRSRSGTDGEARTKARALSLAGVAERITCPLLVVSGSEDRLFPVAHAQRLAGEAGGPATLLLVEGGGHVVNNLPYRYRPQAADWAGDMLMPAAR
jgi:dipeptidyl aminopeptidase/acylaminoacyl peptidase